MGEIVQVNKAFCHMTDYTSEEILQMTFQDIAHPEDYLRGIEHYGQVIAGEIPYHSMEKRYFRKDGSILYTLLTITLHRDLDDTPYYFSQVVDISASKSSISSWLMWLRFWQRARAPISTGLRHPRRKCRLARCKTLAGESKQIMEVSRYSM